MPEYTLEVCDRHGTPVAELPDAQLTSVLWTLNGPGQANIIMKQDDARIAVPDLAKNELRVMIDAWADASVVPWQGPFWQSTEDERACSFDAQTVESYLTRRFIDVSSLYWVDGSNVDVATEQLTIGWNLMQYAQGQLTPTNADKDLYVTSATFTASGKTRLRRYMRDDHANILDLLNEFGGLVDYTTGLPNGFDWAIICYRDGRREWTPYSPQRGTLRDNLTLEFGRNIFGFKVSNSATNITTKTYATGGQTGNIKIEANYKDTTASQVPPTGYGEMVSIISDGSQRDAGELQQKARAYTTLRNKPTQVPDLQAVRVPVELLGVVQPGDTMPVSIHRGRTNIEDNYRVKSVKWAVRPNTLTLEFIPKVS